MKPKVFVTRLIPEPVIRKMEETCEVSVWEYEILLYPGMCWKEK